MTFFSRANAVSREAYDKNDSWFLLYLTEIMDHGTISNGLIDSGRDLEKLKKEITVPQNISLFRYPFQENQLSFFSLKTWIGCFAWNKINHKCSRDGSFKNKILNFFLYFFFLESSRINCLNRTLSFLIIFTYKFILEKSRGINYPITYYSPFLYFIRRFPPYILHLLPQ